MYQPHQAGDDRLVRDYMAVRTSIGAIGMALPLVLVFGGLAARVDLQPSISAYYHTGMRDFFVGSLCAIAVFLWSYRGHDQRDNRAGNLACVAALGVALLPTAPLRPWSGDALVGALHLASAVVFFATLAYFCLGLFTLGGSETPEKRARKRVYRACGWTIIACLALLAVVHIPALATALGALRPVLVLEAVAVFAFGASWFVKGEAILGDRADSREAAPEMVR